MASCEISQCIALHYDYQTSDHFTSPSSPRVHRNDSAEEFYKWMVVNAKSEGMVNEEGTKKMQMRRERLEVGKDGIDSHLMELLEEV